MLIKGLIVGAALMLAQPALAQTFDFESAANTGCCSGAYTTLSMTQGGLTVDIERQGGKSFDIGFAAGPGFGSNSLSPFSDPSTGAFVANFSAALSSISLDFGDYAPSDSDTLSLSIWSGLDGTGILLGTTSFFYDTLGFPVIHTLSLSSATPFLSAIFNGGSDDFPNSVYYDNLVVEGAVPEPATWALMLLGFGAAGYSIRRRRATRSALQVA